MFTKGETGLREGEGRKVRHSAGPVCLGTCCCLVAALVPPPLLRCLLPWDVGCCLRKSGQCLLLVKCFMLYDLQGEIDTWIHSIQRPSRNRLWRPLPPALLSSSASQAPRQGLQTTPQSIRCLCSFPVLCSSKILLHVSSSSKASSFLGLLHILLQRLLG